MAPPLRRPAHYNLEFLQGGRPRPGGRPEAPEVRPVASLAARHEPRIRLERHSSGNRALRIAGDHGSFGVQLSTIPAAGSMAKNLREKTGAPSQSLFPSPRTLMLDRLPSSFVNHIELWLSGAGLLVIFGVSLIVGPSGLAFWRLIALIAVGVGILHGFIFWAVRRRQRQVRRESIREIQQMLSDVLKNKLAAISMYLPEEENQELVGQELNGIRTSIEDIADEVESLSEESIEGWKERYSGAVERTTDL